MQVINTTVFPKSPTTEGFHHIGPVENHRQLVRFHNHWTELLSTRIDIISTNIGRISGSIDGSDAGSLFSLLPSKYFHLLHHHLFHRDLTRSVIVTIVILFRIGIICCGSSFSGISCSSYVSTPPQLINAIHPYIT